MYYEGLDSDFANFIAEKVKYNLYISISDVLTSGLFSVETYANFYKVRPLFNFDSVTSSNPKDHLNNNVLILQKISTTMLSFKSNVEVTNYSEIKTENTIGDIKYTLYYTYDSITGEPAPHKLTSNGNTTDSTGHYLDCEVVS